MALRHWSPARFALLWGAVTLLCLGAWRILAWGTIQGRVIDLTETEVTGQWSPGFASGAMTTLLLGSAVFLAVATGIWLRGRKERAGRKIADSSADNRILIGPPRPNAKKGIFNR